ncbi:cation:proton antiporter [Arsenicitalea aurantiaca]|uniref:Cation:proton antiporter n=1 Tax=Arsenicitalea aurantiaca TaxID=1783274 RepID=A0A433X2N8_9HYPH|nr:NADH-quinone oxidoreductase subunit K [Arsenicitalea aurantiaca]RUT28348.1 cation:proton antiporter [Arsenicitalea aurantiaca]
MNLVYAAALAALMGCGLYMLLSRQVVRIILGIALISAAVNFVIFFAGRIGASVPPLIIEGETALGPDTANPLPQALVLTAIVIGFSLVAFAAALALKTYRETGTLDTRELGDAEALGSPYTKEASSK